MIFQPSIIHAGLTRRPRSPSAILNGTPWRSDVMGSDSVGLTTGGSLITVACPILPSLPQYLSHFYIYIYIHIHTHTYIYAYIHTHTHKTLPSSGQLAELHPTINSRLCLHFFNKHLPKEEGGQISLVQKKTQSPFCYMSILLIILHLRVKRHLEFMVRTASRHRAGVNLSLRSVLFLRELNRGH